MLERFTERARKVMALANQEAQRFNYEYVGTEHMLLGLVKEGSGVGANVLKNLGVDLAKVRAEVEKLVRPGPDKVTKGKLPTTPRAKKVTEYAINEARELNHNYIGTEHLLLGLLCESEGVASQVLTGLGMKLDKVREEVLRLLGAGAEPKEAPAANRPAKLLFTERAGRVMALANREAQILNHEYVGTEHLLLALVKEGSGVGANVLKNLGVTAAPVLADVENLLKPGPDKVARGKLAITRYEKVIDYAAQEALRRKRRYFTYVGTGHLLVGLVREREGIAGQVLAGLGVKLYRVREEILRMVGENGEPEGAEATRASQRSAASQSSKAATHLNVEVKARYALPGRVQEVLQDPHAEFRGVDSQVDTYFNCPNGRLKLREGKIETALIHYQRPDVPGPKESVVCLYHPDDPAGLKEALTRACGVLVTVKKKRQIYRIDNVEFHVDHVEGLGDFIEIEAADADAAGGIEKLRRQCEQYMKLLGVGEADLIGESYADLLSRPRSTGL